MTDCSDTAQCPNGNCIGCKDGQTWCGDPRCAPYCPGEICVMDGEHDNAINIVIIVILLCLITILIIVWFFYGPSFFRQYKLAPGEEIHMS